jgi:hypothetical protein
LSHIVIAAVEIVSVLNDSIKQREAELECAQQAERLTLTLTFMFLRNTALHCLVAVVKTLEPLSELCPAAELSLTHADAGVSNT